MGSECDTVTPDIMRWMQATVTFRVSKSLGCCWSAALRCTSLKTFDCKPNGPRRLGHSYKYCSVSARVVTVVTALLVVSGTKTAGKRGRTAPHYQSFSVRFKNVRSECSYECTAKRVNVFESCITLTGPSVVSLAATTPCRVQLCTVLGR
jgi:hypothetical protein